MTILFADTETYSSTPIKDGIYAYSYAPDTEVTLFSYAFDNEPVQVVDLANGEKLPKRVMDALEDESVTVVFHNAMFDRNVVEKSLGIRLNPKRLHCTMVQAFAHGLPGKLDVLCDIFKLPISKAKHKNGRALMLLFCKPRNGERLGKKTHPEKWEEFKAYAVNDTVAMREIFNKVPMWNYRGIEKDLWVLDQHINDRGFAVDLELANKALEAVNTAQEILAKRTSKATNGEVAKASQRDMLLKYILEEHGIELPNMQASTLRRRLEDPELPDAVRDLIAIRLETSITSTAKYKSLLKATSADGRLRGMIQYDGAARTRRASGRTWQIQNLPKPTHSHEDIELGIRAIKSDCVDLIFDNVMAITSSCVRGCIVSSENKKIFVSDLSNIEGRIVAWLAGEDWKIKAFKEYDEGIGHDLYKLAYAKAFKKAPEDVTKDERQVGKVLELSCIAENELVLTDKGLIPIQKVTTEEKVWDGACFVEHCGVVYRGIKEVITYDGLTATKDHIVWTEDGRNLQFGDCANEQIRLLQTGLGRMPLRKMGDSIAGYRMERRNGQERLSVQAQVCKGGVPRVFQRTSKNIRKHFERKINTVHEMRESCKSATMVVEESSSYEIEMRNSKQQRVSQLRRERYKVLISVGGGRGGMDTGELRYSERQRFRSQRQSRTLRSRESKMGYQIGEYEKLSPFKIITYRFGVGRKRKSIRETCDKAVYDTRIQQRGGNRISVQSSVGQTQELGSHKTEIRESRVYDIINAGPNNRFTVSDKLVHNCGYAGGVSAFLTFAAVYELDLDKIAKEVLPTLPKHILVEATGFYEWTIKCKRSTFGLDKETFIVCDGLKRMWREAHPNVVSFWAKVETAAEYAIANKDKVYYATDRVKAVRTGPWLNLILPSGARLCYPAPSIDKNQITYMGMNQYTKKWQRTKTFGGKLLENLSQSIARDIMYQNMFRVEEAGYDILSHVHDELITEAPDNENYTAEHLSELLSTNPVWSTGLPLAAGGFETYRYKKGD